MGPVRPMLASATGKMVGMFNWASAFNAEISSWDVSKVTNVAGLFNEASAFNADISTWDVNQVTDIEAMPSGASE